jgi:3D (Asp-Asp-Asp) domain-containing protein
VVAFGALDDSVPLPDVFAASQPPPEPTTAVLPLRLEGVVVFGAPKRWYATMRGRARAGEPVPVLVTAYCLSGTTRRGRYVRHGIVAADPKLFPLSRYIELYAGTKYLGRYLVDDTGGRIRGPHIDVWMPTCREAIVFGRRRGTAALVQRSEVQVVQTGTQR